MLAFSQALTTAHSHSIRLFFDLSRPFFKNFLRRRKQFFIFNLLFYKKFLQHLFILFVGIKQFESIFGTLFFRTRRTFEKSKALIHPRNTAVIRHQIEGSHEPFIQCRVHIIFIWYATAAMFGSVDESQSQQPFFICLKNACQIKKE